MGERLLCKQEVIGSIPFTSTTALATPRPPPRPKAVAGATIGEKHGFAGGAGFRAVGGGL